MREEANGRTACGVGRGGEVNRDGRHPTTRWAGSTSHVVKCHASEGASISVDFVYCVCVSCTCQEVRGESVLESATVHNSPLAIPCGAAAS